MKTTRKMETLVTVCNMCGVEENGMPGGWYKSEADTVHLCPECMDLAMSMTRNRGRPRGETSGLEALFR